MRYVLASAAVLTTGWLACSGGGEPPSPANLDGAPPRTTPDAAPLEAGTVSPEGSPATLAEYWRGNAKWSLVRTYTQANTSWPYGFGAAHITITEGTWYLFSRKLAPSLPSYCPAGLGHALSMEVRMSDDQGKTWQAPVEILPNVQGSKWECAAADGDAYYDAAARKWHYVFQCLDRSGTWAGCHVEREAVSPVGPFVETIPNPVIPAKSLWNKICDKPEDACVRIPGKAQAVFDEGTFNIWSSGGAIFAGFHGYDGTNGYRGVAKTTDFKTWIAGDPAQGVPADAIWDRERALPWREVWQGAGPTGGGAGSILDEDGYLYSLVESGDLTLGCVDGQRWDWGISRTRELAANKWEQFPAGNPILYSNTVPERAGKSIACNPAYARMVRDAATGTTFMHVTRESLDPAYSGIYLYRLESSANLLVNGDLWKCSAAPWERTGTDATNLAVYRNATGSTDGNCYLATNCGKASCQPDQSVYQDVEVKDIGGREIEFGGKFAIEGVSGPLTLTLHELAATGEVVATHVLPIRASSTYARFATSATADAKTSKLRYQVYLRSPETFRADEMWVTLR